MISCPVWKSVPWCAVRRKKRATDELQFRIRNALPPIAYRMTVADKASNFLAFRTNGLCCVRVVSATKVFRALAKCSLCHHPERHRIEMLRLAGTPLEALSERFALGDTIAAGRDRLWRHMRQHVTRDHRAALLADIPLSELAERAASENASVLDHLQIVRSNLMGMFLTAAGAGEAKTAALVSGRLLETLRDQAHLTGELMSNGPVMNFNITNIINSPMFAALQAMLIEKLKPHPLALAEVVQGLRELEASQPPLIDGVANAA
jgi:hypothetical protein